MGAILTITLPIFAVVGLGYATVRGGLFKPADMRVLGGFVLNIALPALLFNAVARRALGEVLHPVYLAVFLLGGLATILVTYLWFTLQGTGPARRAIASMGAACPNSGYVGYPVMLIVLPDLAGAILAMNMLIENFVLIPICLILLELSRDRENKSLTRLISTLFLSIVKRPMVIGLLLGLLVALFQVPIPAVIVRLLDMLAASTSAVALFVIGGALYGLPVRGNRAMAAQIVAAKLVLHPALTALVLLALPLLGIAALPPSLHLAVILSTAMPMFSIYTILAQGYGHEGLASLALLGATAGAFFTLSALLSWLG